MYRLLRFLPVSAALLLGGCDESIAITDVHYTPLYEGLGCGPGGCEGTCTVAGCPGGRRAPLVVFATSAPIVSASATFAGVDVPVAVDLLEASAGRVALAVRIPVTTALGPNTPFYELELRVVGLDGSEGTTSLLALGLAELTLGDPQAEVRSGTYSTIVVPTAIVARAVTSRARARRTARSCRSATARAGPKSGAPGKPTEKLCKRGHHAGPRSSSSTRLSL